MASILFINASKQWEGRTYKEYPYGIGILATLATAEGYDVSILDMAVDKRNYLTVLKETDPDIVAITFMSPSAKIAADVIQHIRIAFTGNIVAGGIHSTIYPMSVISYGADVVILGEGELSFLAVVKALLCKNKSVCDSALDCIPNLVYADSCGEIRKTHSRKQSVNLDDLPVMDRNLFNLGLYAHHTILTSRCCPYQCRFCCSWAPGGKRGRIMSSNRIMKSLEWLVQHYGTLVLYWGDEIFFWNKHERMQFCKLLKERQLPIKFIVQLRADLVDSELIDALLSVGCVKVCIGAESGSDRLLSAANKKISAKQIENAINTCVRAGMSCKTWWMVGLPGGGIEDQLKALEIIENSRPNEVAIHQFVPLPGSEFWDKASQYGIHLPDISSFESLNYYSDPTKLSYDYISGDELYEILKTYELNLLSMGYVPTDQATDDSQYVFTTPFQHQTFQI